MLTTRKKIFSYCQKVHVVTTLDEENKNFVLVSENAPKTYTEQIISEILVDDLLSIQHIVPPRKWEWMLKDEVVWIKVRMHKERNPLFAHDPVITKVIWWKPPGMFYNLPNMYIIEPLTVKHPRIIRIGDWDAIAEICKICLKMIRAKYVAWQNFLRRL